MSSRWLKKGKSNVSSIETELYFDSFDAVSGFERNFGAEPAGHVPFSGRARSQAGRPERQGRGDVIRRDVVPLASKELPALQKIADRYSSRGVQVYWVSINSSKPGARNYPRTPTCRRSREA